mmetsp:Transcript_24385/g.69915  ORF Transcript_24385/g.69915 Transcript_24385/m.69915 type:complete len:422 (-) Transcript_24385:837-2102(-)
MILLQGLLKIAPVPRPLHVLHIGLEVLHALVGDALQVPRRQQARAGLVELRGRAQVGPVEEDPLLAKPLPPRCVALSWGLHRQDLVICHDVVDEHSHYPWVWVHALTSGVTVAVGELHILGGHVLAGEEVALAIVTAEYVVVLQIQLRKLLEGAVLELANSAPRLRLLAAVCQHCPNPFRQTARKQGRQTVQALVFHEEPETLVAVVLHDGLVHVGACGEEDQAAGRHVGLAPVQGLEHLQAARVHAVLGEVPVTARGEGAAARVKRVVHVTEDLDADAAFGALPCWACGGTDKQRLLPEVQLDGLARLLRGDVLVDQLVQVVVVASSIDEVLELCELPSAAAEDEVRHGLLVAPPELRAALLQRVDYDGLLYDAQATALQGLVADQVDGGRRPHLNQSGQVQIPDRMPQDVRVVVSQETS